MYDQSIYMSWQASIEKKMNIKLENYLFLGVFLHRMDGQAYQWGSYYT